MPKRSKPAVTVFVPLLSSLLFVSQGAHAQAPACAVDTVPRAELAAEMRTAAVSHGDYDLLATTNWTRFQSALYLQLVRNAMEREPLGGMLFIPSADLFWEFLSVSGLVDPKGAPTHLLWSLHLAQGTHLEYGLDSIVRSVLKGAQPILVVNVRIGWPDRPDGTEKYSFIDTLSVPELRVTNHQEITFRMLDFGEMVVYDKVEGASGRPLSGVLGALFKVIGEGDVKWARAGISEDGIQVVRAQVKKLKEDLDLEYYPYGCW